MTYRRISWIVLGVGLAATITGGVLYCLQPRKETPARTPAPLPQPRVPGAAVDQRWERGREMLVLGFREYTFAKTIREGESFLMTGPREPGNDRVVSLLATWRAGDQLAMN